MLGLLVRSAEIAAQALRIHSCLLIRSLPKIVSLTAETTLWFSFQYTPFKLSSAFIRSRCCLGIVRIEKGVLVDRLASGGAECFFVWQGNLDVWEDY